MKSLDKFTKDRFDSLVVNLTRYHQFQDNASLHHIRVELKKIKAVLDLMDATLKGFDGHEQYIPLRNIFRQAGRIWQAEVMFNLLIGHGLEGLPIDQLGYSTQAKEEFRVELPFFLEQLEYRSKKIRKRLKEIRSIELSRHLRKQMKAIKLRLVPKLMVKELHSVRKRIKVVVYLSDLVGFLGKRKARFCSNLEHSIGKLHDQEVLLGFLASSSAKVDPAAITKLRKACRRDRKMIGALAKKFYS